MVRKEKHHTQAYLQVDPRGVVHERVGKFFDLGVVQRGRAHNHLQPLSIGRLFRHAAEKKRKGGAVLRAGVEGGAVSLCATRRAAAADGTLPVVQLLQQLAVALREEAINLIQHIKADLWRAPADG